MAATTGTRRRPSPLDRLPPGIRKRVDDAELRLVPIMIDDTPLASLSWYGWGGQTRLGPHDVQHDEEPHENE